MSGYFNGVNKLNMSNPNVKGDLPGVCDYIEQLLKILCRQCGILYNFSETVHYDPREICRFSNFKEEYESIMETPQERCKNLMLYISRILADHYNIKSNTMTIRALVKDHIHTDICIPITDGNDESDLMCNELTKQFNEMITTLKDVARNLKSDEDLTDSQIHDIMYTYMRLYQWCMCIVTMTKSNIMMSYYHQLYIRRGTSRHLLMIAERAKGIFELMPTVGIMDDLGYFYQEIKRCLGLADRVFKYYDDTHYENSCVDEEYYDKVISQMLHAGALNNYLIKLSNIDVSNIDTIAKRLHPLKADGYWTHSASIKDTTNIISAALDTINPIIVELLKARAILKRLTIAERVLGHINSYYSKYMPALPDRQQSVNLRKLIDSLKIYGDTLNDVSESETSCDTVDLPSLCLSNENIDAAADSYYANSPVIVNRREIIENIASAFPEIAMLADTTSELAYKSFAIMQSSIDRIDAFLIQPDEYLSNLPRTDILCEIISEFIDYAILLPHVVLTSQDYTKSLCILHYVLLGVVNEVYEKECRANIAKTFRKKVATAINEKTLEVSRRIKEYRDNYPTLGVSKIAINKFHSGIAYTTVGVMKDIRELLSDIMPDDAVPTKMRHEPFNVSYEGSIQDLLEFIYFNLGTMNLSIKIYEKPVSNSQWINREIDISRDRTENITNAVHKYSESLQTMRYNIDMCIALIDSQL